MRAQLRLQGLLALVVATALVACGGDGKKSEAPKPVPVSSVVASPSASVGPVAVEPGVTLRLMAFNVYCGAGVNPRWDSCAPLLQPSTDRYSRVVEFIKKADPDILGLQEANSWEEGNPSAIQRLAGELGMKYVVANGVSQFKVILLSKYEIKNVEDLSSTLGSHGLIKAEVTLPNGKTLNVLVTHLNPTQSFTSRDCQVDAMLAATRKYLSRPTVFMGDFNFATGSPWGRRMVTAGWKIAAIGPSFGGVDLIWMSPALDWTPDTTWWGGLQPVPQGLSDHQPVGVRAAIKERIADPTPAVTAPVVASQVRPLPWPLDGRFAPETDSAEDFTGACAVMRWQIGGDKANIANGELSVPGEENYRTQVRHIGLAAEGSGRVVYFKYDAASQSNIIMNNGDFNTDAFRQFGLSVNNGNVAPAVWQGKNPVQRRFTGSLVPRPGDWYGVLMYLSPQGNFEATIWDASNPSSVLTLTEPIGAPWRNAQWQFGMGANRGVLTIDDYMSVTAK